MKVNTNLWIRAKYDSNNQFVITAHTEPEEKAFVPTTHPTPQQQQPTTATAAPQVFAGGGLISFPMSEKLLESLFPDREVNYHRERARSRRMRRSFTGAQ
jgi:hypothetical protein